MTDRNRDLPKKPLLFYLQMMSYRDICFCLASRKMYEGKKCVNSDCIRHASQIPNNLPEWELIAWSDFSEKCKCFKKDGVENV